MKPKKEKLVEDQVGMGFSKNQRGRDTYKEMERERERGDRKQQHIDEEESLRVRKVRKRNEGSASRGPDLTGESADFLKERGTSETAGCFGE